jgi:hypothetical protein
MVMSVSVILKLVGPLVAKAASWAIDRFLGNWKTSLLAVPAVGSVLAVLSYFGCDPSLAEKLLVSLPAVLLAGLSADPDKIVPTLLQELKVKAAEVKKE